MSIHPLAGQPVPQNLLADLGALRDAYFSHQSDVTDAGHRWAAPAPRLTEMTRVSMTEISAAPEGSREDGVAQLSLNRFIPALEFGADGQPLPYRPARTRN